MSLTCLPCRVSQCLRVLGPCVRHRHRLVCSGLLVLHLVYGERANRKAVARHGPAPLAYQHDRRLSGTAYGCTKTWLWWFAAQARQAFPPSEDGLLSLVGDRTLQGTRGPQQPVAQNTRLSRYHPSVFDVRSVILLAPWDVFRLPRDVALVRRQGPPGSQTAQALWRQLRQDCRRPAWGQELVVTADAASASRAHVTLIHTPGYGDVMALPRPWKFAHGKARKALVTHLPRGQ